MKYRDYTIRRCGDNYCITTPAGETWSELAVNIETAKRWIDCHIAERRANKALP